MNKMLIKKNFFLLLFTLFVSEYVLAQSSEVKGQVSDAKSGNPLSGVTVVEVNQNDRQVNGTNTDNDGNFSIRISNSSNKLRFSFIGYETASENLTGRTTINVRLYQDTSRKGMDEVVVVARRADQVSNGYSTTNKRDLIGSVSTIKADVLENQPVTSIDQMIQGRASGVQVVSNSGDPGAGVDIRIRGAGSISGGNDPLYIVDGIPIISTPFDNSAAGQNVARINPIADINPSDIERIDILKDANASAIYGARAANGVIVITTKRGKPGRVDIVLNTRYTIQTPPPSIPVLSGPQYKVMRIEALQNQGNINPLSDAVRPLIDDPTYAGYLYYQNNTDWMKALKQTGLTHWYNLSVTGGSEAMRYNFSASYTNTRGSFINTGFKRLTTSFRLDYKVSNRLRFSANVAFTRSHRNDHANYQGTVYTIGHLRNPALPIYDVDVNGNQLPTYFSLPGNQGSMDNPVAFARTVDNNAFSTNLKPNIRADLDIIKGLRFSSVASTEFVGENGLTFFPPEATGVIWNDVRFNAVDTRDYERMQMVLENYLSYTRSISSKLKANFLLGNTFNSFNSSQLLVGNFATGSLLLNTLGAAGGYSRISSSKSTEKIASVYAQSNFVYNDRYGLNLTIRRDGSSKFGGNNKYGNFPSVGVYWRASAEPFLASLKFLTDLKFRATWGQLGNSGIPNYAFISQFGPGANYIGNTGVSQLNPQLNDLRWETVESANAGVDVTLFNGRVTGTVEYYQKTTKDLLYNLTVPTSSGLTGSILTNLGNIRNRGIEVDFSYNAIKAKKPGRLDWTLAFNIAHNENMVTSLPGGTLKNPNGAYGFGSQIKQGDPLGTYYGLIYKGVYATDNDAVVKDAKGSVVYNLDGVTPRKMRLTSETGDTLRGGDAIYEDFNNDGVINDQDRVLIGNGNPMFFGGLNSDLSFGNFSLKVFVQFQYGNDIINGMRYTLEKMDNSDNQAITTLKRWRKQGDVTDMPRALNGSNRNYQGSTRWIEDGSYARLKLVTLTYRFPRQLVQRLRLNGIDAFITANDIVTITNYKGADPEISLSPFGNDPAFIGVDRGLTPRGSGYTLGINFRF
ncbi:MAG TPA: TonB-dependent receptor [Chitinophagaceae bacterium]|nr:TonB-dependent receptor [Chitinophagaceae bacterium]